MSDTSTTPLEQDDRLHTVLGASGAMGHAVLDELAKKKVKTRAVTTRSKIEGHEVMHADLRDPAQAKKAIAGSKLVYLCVGLPYNHKVWEKDWPTIMENVINACVEEKARLIFLDNVYMYHTPFPKPFQEDAALNPSTKKGIVREKIAGMMIKAIQDGRLSGTIARSADFYGKRATNSMLYISFLERMLKGKDPYFMTTPDKLHTYAYVRDNARAMILLAENEDCCGQVWHLPVGEPITTTDLLEHFNKAIGNEFKIKAVPKLMELFLSLFVPAVKEVDEMLFQFENDYVMSWEKFRLRFPDFKVTPYNRAVAETVKYFEK